MRDNYTKSDRVEYYSIITKSYIMDWLLKPEQYYIAKYKVS
jgi:hypothetical protein